MNTLVIIPSLPHKFSFSAPLAWLFSDHIDHVRGIYGYMLNEQLAKEYTSFIVELNWFIELYEFELIVAFIKKHNPDSKILFGGLYSQLKYKELFERNNVDYFIKGDSELPLKLYLDGNNPKTIPNFVGKDFENEQTYIFDVNSYKDISFNLDWIPEHQDLWNSTAEPDDNISINLKNMPLYPKYWESKTNLPEELKWRVPFTGGKYHLPMLITSRGQCVAAHEGCDYCMGSKSNIVNNIFKRGPIIMDNSTLIHHLKNIEKKFKRICLFINTPLNFDLRGYSFDLEVTIEIDSFVKSEDLSKILYSFKKAVVHTAIYDEGLTGKDIRTNIAEFQKLEDENHKIYFFAFNNDSELIPKNRRLYAELVLPSWTNWSFYNDINNALKKSKEWYLSTGQLNLYPLPKQKTSKFIRFFVIRILFVLNRLKIINLQKKIF